MPCGRRPSGKKTMEWKGKGKVKKGLITFLASSLFSLLQVESATSDLKKKRLDRATIILGPTKLKPSCWDNFGGKAYCVLWVK